MPSSVENSAENVAQNVGSHNFYYTTFSSSVRISKRAYHLKVYGIRITLILLSCLETNLALPRLLCITMVFFVMRSRLCEVGTGYNYFHCFCLPFAMETALYTLTLQITLPAETKCSLEFILVSPDIFHLMKSPFYCPAVCSFISLV